MSRKDMVSIHPIHPLDYYQRRNRFTVESIMKSSQTSIVQQWTISVKKISKQNPSPKYLGPVCG